MDMKKKIIVIAALAAALISGCAKSPVTGLNDASKKYLEAWIQVHHPDAQKTSMGSYIIEDEPGTGASLGDPDDWPYVRVYYTSRTLDGTIQTTNYENVAKQLGTYEENNYYGPKVWCRQNFGINAGVEDVISTMKIGGKRTAMIPGWLMSSTEYSSAEDYFLNGSGTNVIYTIEPVEAIEDIVEWEIDSLSTYMTRNFPDVALTDSVKYGYYYVRVAEPLDTCGFHKDTTIYINYIGRLLNGTVFDTNIADTAKYYGIYSSSNTYGPVEISAKEEYASTTMGSSSSSVIDGFAYTIYQMHSYEKGTGIFYSAYGYTSSGSGETIPPYSPLRFDIEVVDND